MENGLLTSPFMSRGFAPIGMECDYAHLVVEGTIPQQLNGTFYRIGPNPQFPPRGTYNPLNGDGMVHAFRVSDGCVAYRKDRKSTRLNSSHRSLSRMPSSA